MILNGQIVDGRKFRKPVCEHVWADTHTDATHIHSKCELCKRVKARKVKAESKRTYRPRMIGIGTNVAGVPYRMSKDTTALPKVFRGLNTVRA